MMLGGFSYIDSNWIARKMFFVNLFLEFYFKEQNLNPIVKFQTFVRLHDQTCCFWKNVWQIYQIHPNKLSFFEMERKNVKVPVDKLIFHGNLSFQLCVQLINKFCEYFVMVIIKILLFTVGLHFMESVRH